MKYILAMSAFLFMFGMPTQSQAYSSLEQEAMYIATLKAVLDYKMEDEKNLKRLERLRSDRRFNQKLEKMLGELNNKKVKFGKNKKVYDILVKAGKDIYNTLD